MNDINRFFPKIIFTEVNNDDNHYTRKPTVSHPSLLLIHFYGCPCVTKIRFPLTLSKIFYGCLLHISSIRVRSCTLNVNGGSRKSIVFYAFLPRFLLFPFVLSVAHCFTPTIVLFLHSVHPAIHGDEYKRWAPMSLKLILNFVGQHAPVPYSPHTVIVGTGVTHLNNKSRRHGRTGVSIIHVRQTHYTYNGQQSR